MKVILFIGHHKVGSTSLQDFLSRNSTALARSGILYPATDFEGMSLMLAAAMGGGVGNDPVPINAREPHNALAFRMMAKYRKGGVPPYHEGLPSQIQMARAIQNQIKFLNPHTVVLAGEVFANFAPVSQNLIGDLASIFPDDAEITLVATLRRIDEYLASWHGQRLKFGHKIEPLRTTGMQAYFKGIHFNYRKMLEGWLTELPQAQLILRDYNDVRTAGGSVKDFVSQTGLTLPEGLQPEQKTNESLHRGIYEIARLGNAKLEPVEARELRKLLKQSSPELDLPASNDIELFGRANRQEMLEQFEPVHDYLCQVSGQTTFFSELDVVGKPFPIPEVDVFEDVVAKLSRRLPRTTNAPIREFIRDINARKVKPNASATH